MACMNLTQMLLSISDGGQTVYTVVIGHWQRHVCQKGRYSITMPASAVLAKCEVRI